MDQYHVAAQKIQTAFKCYTSDLRRSKCCNCRILLGDAICVYTISCKYKFGAYRHKKCNIEKMLTICPYCNIDVSDSYVYVRCVNGDIPNEPKFIHEKTVNGIQKWHMECHRAMTFGFVNKNTPDCEEIDDPDYRGKCLVCGENVMNNMHRHQGIRATRGTKGSYIHGRCRMLWNNPHFIHDNCKIKYMDGLMTFR